MNAPASSNVSPGARWNSACSESSPTPTAANKAAAHENQWTGFFQIRNTMTGTRITYSPVIKLAFPTVVVARPACCSAEAAYRSTPASSTHGTCLRSTLNLNLVSGSSRSAPNRNRPPLKIKCIQVTGSNPLGDEPTAPYRRRQQQGEIPFNPG